MQQLNTIYTLLLNKFGAQGWWPVAGKYAEAFKHRKKTEEEKFEIAVGAILTQSTNWKNVEKALDSLKNSNALNAKAIQKMPLRRLASVIRSSGYHTQKAKKLKALVDYRGEITREGLLSVWGIGPETADSILLYAYDLPYFVADAYTKRIFSRYGFVDKDAGYGEVQRVFHNFYNNYFNRKDKEKVKAYNEYHALIVELGKNYCKKKPLCSRCPINNGCKKLGV